MIALPAIDLREGACVQLVGGRYQDERVRLPDPLAVAQGFCRAGFRGLHVVDLDAATGRGSNKTAVAALLQRAGLPVQVGGGVRQEAAIAELLEAGAERVVVGTRALEEPPWLERVAARFPRRLVVALDVRGREPMLRGWTESAPATFEAIIPRLDPLPLAGVLITAVHQEGRLAGPDFALMREAAAATSLPLQASGGIRSLPDLRALAGLGVRAAVLGMALYTETLDPRQVAEEFDR